MEAVLNWGNRLRKSTSRRMHRHHIWKSFYLSPEQTMPRSVSASDLGSLGRDNLLLPSTFPQLVGIQIPETTKLKCVEFPHIICHVSFCL